MHCFVTAGPTWEPLDQARRLTNFSTGRLGGELANALIIAGHSVDLFLSETALWQAPLAALTLHRFSTTRSLEEAIRAVATSMPIAFFHAAAVSDFSGVKAYRRTAEGTLEPVSGGKPTTSGGTLWVELQTTPKILPRLRDWFPQGRLTGWKYEVEGGVEDALARGFQQMGHARTDACVVNGPAYGEGFGVVSPTGKLRRCATRDELIQHLVSAVDDEVAPGDDFKRL